MGLFQKDKLQIICFRGYGTSDKLHLRGRALEDERIDLEKKGIFALLLNTWKRFETDEIKKARIHIKTGELITLETRTDINGYYLVTKAEKHLSKYTDADGWLPVEVSFEADDLIGSINANNCFKGEMLIPGNNADYGVISDIDDTILHTGVVSSLKWRVLVNTIFKRAVSRDALAGTADFYHKLHRGVSGNSANPIFYVSHSPWNLYRYLELFLETNNFPKGPILLRSISSFTVKNRKKHVPQKQREIVNILKTYPKLCFILIGDSGEMDGLIYKAIAMEYPKQIKAIYLRSVNDVKRNRGVSELFQGFDQIPFLLVRETKEAIAHAKEEGYI
jgi:phosphatidate phosphatase APP1